MRMKIISGLMQKPGKMLLSGPAGEKKLGAPATRSRVHGSRPDLDQSPDGLPVWISLKHFAEKCSYKQICSKTDEKKTLINIQLYTLEYIYIPQRTPCRGRGGPQR